jgi:hypothetical protein
MGPPAARCKTLRGLASEPWTPWTPWTACGPVQRPWRSRESRVSRVSMDSHGVRSPAQATLKARGCYRCRAGLLYPLNTLSRAIRREINSQLNFVQFVLYTDVNIVHTTSELAAMFSRRGNLRGKSAGSVLATAWRQFMGWLASRCLGSAARVGEAPGGCDTTLLAWGGQALRAGRPRAGPLEDARPAGKPPVNH